jgi:hypothetical protein
MTLCAMRAPARCGAARRATPAPASLRAPRRPAAATARRARPRAAAAAAAAAAGPQSDGQTTEAAAQRKALRLAVYSAKPYGARLARARWRLGARRVGPGTQASPPTRSQLRTAGRRFTWL